MGSYPRKTFVRRSTESRPNRVVIAAFLGLVIGLVFVQPRGQAQAAAPPDALPYSGGYLVTGNYVVCGVDLTEALNPPDANGLSTATIHVNKCTSTVTFNCIPDDADIVAAYL